MGWRCPMATNWHLGTSTPTVRAKLTPRRCHWPSPKLSRLRSVKVRMSPRPMAIARTSLTRRVIAKSCPRPMAIMKMSRTRSGLD